MNPMTYAAAPMREMTMTASRGSSRKLGTFAVRTLSAFIGWRVLASA